MDIYLDGRRIRLDPQKSVGKGGEADVYDIGGDTVVKIFKQPNHPDFSLTPMDQQMAKMRIEEHQKKLPAFPKGLPPRVITPTKLVTNQSGKKILGYAMPHLKNAEVLLRYGDKKFREAGVPDETVMAIMRDLHNTVTKIHPIGAVISDFNDLNVLVIGEKAYIIDADSFGYDKFLSKMFTARFVDPLVCDQNASRLMLIRPHTPDTDWYAFTVMLMKLLLFAGPYDGVYRPKDKTKRVKHDARPLKRITIFDPEIRYPKPARPLTVLPDEMLHHFHLVFEKDQRGEFPLTLLENTRWTTCTVCGTNHARATCPECANIAPGAIKETISVRGQVRATQFFTTKGKILASAMQDGKLLYLYYEEEKFKREDKSTIEIGGLDPQLRIKISRDETLLGKHGKMIVCRTGQKPEVTTVDSYRSLPLFDVNERHRYWAQGGTLWKNGQYGDEQIGNVLTNQTLFWVGPKFGFGFYQAGDLNISFVFSASAKGINDNVQVPPVKGQLIDSTCMFSSSHCWFFTSFQDGGKIINRCCLIRQNGEVEATIEAEAGDDSWLGTIRGKCATGNMLLVATDDGIVQVKAEHGKIFVAKEFPDTESFVSQDSQLLPGNDGIYVVSLHTITKLEIR